MLLTQSVYEGILWHAGLLNEALRFNATFAPSAEITFKHGEK